MHTPRAVRLHVVWDSRAAMRKVILCWCSGHGAMKENYYLDDGTYSASQIVIVMVKRHLEGLGKDIYGSLLADLKEPMESSEFRLKLKVRPPFKEGVS